MTKKRIIVIDDEQAVRYAFELALEDSGYEVVTVNGGEEGVKQIQNSHFDLVFLDLKMPGMNGAETLRAIGKLQPALPVYIVTTFHREFFDDLASAKKDGLKFQLLRKPIGNADILLIANSVLGNVQKF